MINICVADISLLTSIIILVFLSGGVLFDIISSKELPVLSISILIAIAILIYFATSASISVGVCS